MGALLKGSLLERLRILDFSLGTLTDDGAQQILGKQIRLAHLEKLNLRENHPSAPVAKAPFEALEVVDVRE